MKRGTAVLDRLGTAKARMHAATRALDVWEAPRRADVTLIVDDDADTAEMLAQALEATTPAPGRPRRAARLAATGKAALAALREGGIGQVILDWRLPDGPPTGVIQAARAAGIPVVLFTGSDVTVEGVPVVRKPDLHGLFCRLR